MTMTISPLRFGELRIKRLDSAPNTPFDPNTTRFAEQVENVLKQNNSATNLTFQKMIQLAEQCGKDLYVTLKKQGNDLLGDAWLVDISRRGNVGHTNVIQG